MAGSRRSSKAPPAGGPPPVDTVSMATASLFSRKSKRLYERPESVGGHATKKVQASSQTLRDYYGINLAHAPTLVEQ